MSQEVQIRNPKLKKNNVKIERDKTENHRPFNVNANYAKVRTIYQLSDVYLGWFT